MDRSRRGLIAASSGALAGGALWYAAGRVETADSGSRSDDPVDEPEPIEGAVSGVEDPSDVDGATLAQVVEANVEFGVTMLRELGDDPGENLLVSPASVGFAIGMLYAGARGETETAIADALGFPADQTDLHPVHQQLQYDLDERVGAVTDGEFDLAVANAVWGLEEYPYREPYLETLETRYGTGLHAVDFRRDPEGSREEINEWAADRTDGLIDELFPPQSIDSDTRLVLTNAIYLLADWLEQFDEERTREEPFTTLDGRTVEAKLMRQTAAFPYADVDGHQIVELPYVGEEVGLLAVLPAEGEFETLEASIDAATLSTFVDELEEKRGEVVVPRFEFDVGFSLTDLLSELGMAVAFDPGSANFDGIAAPDDREGNLYVGDVVQDAYIAVDEEGTEAAAATGVEVGVESAPQTEFRFVADRPFLFAIRDRQTGALLFLGRVVDPTR
ncbi:serpin family protein [Natrarchaeobius sp. A-rgal3]|uniref:serpin family protein n=1 Tax=Natrarchaeobius versutus TaxID=1679078 RepID=UPI00350EC411